VDVLADFHGSLDNPQLVLLASGNYFFALGELVTAFGDSNPHYRGHVFYETLPPGLLLKQMDAGGTVTSGNMTWTVKPDIYLAELAASTQLVASGRLVAPVITFATNDLASWCGPAIRRVLRPWQTSGVPVWRLPCRIRNSKGLQGRSGHHW
jgi:molybdate transport system substrate-binding protein